MGILNVTPDSFSDGGKYLNFENAIKHIEKLIKLGVNIIDIGGESTRPGATTVSEEDECKRVIPIVKWCRGEACPRPSGDLLISIDTYKSNVAREALQEGANIVNDVSGLTKDPNMVKVVAEFNSLVIIMHNKGIPATKPEHNSPSITEEVFLWLKKQTNYAIQNGVKQENIIIDPGIGFGKTPEEDLILIENLKEFKSLGFPVLVGSSGKSFIKKLFGEENFETKNQEMIDLAINNGANIIRAHY